MKRWPESWGSIRGIAALIVIALTVVCVCCGTAPGGVTTSTGVVTTMTEGPSPSSSGASTATSQTNPFTAIKATSSTTTTAEATSGSSTTGLQQGGGSSTSTSATSQSTSSSSTTTTHPTTTTKHPTTTTTQPTTTTTTVGVAALQVSGPSGTKSFTMAQLKAKTSVSGYWGPHKDGGANHSYKGVPLLSLLADVGGLPSGSGLEVNTSDNFACSYTSTQLSQMADGTYQMWKVADGSETTGSVQLIVAYEMDGSPLDAATGPLRIVLVRPAADMLTEGKYSPFWVISVAVQ
jgi:hypothetical protein